MNSGRVVESMQMLRNFRERLRSALCDDDTDRLKDITWCVFAWNVTNNRRVAWFLGCCSGLSIFFVTVKSRILFGWKCKFTPNKGKSIAKNDIVTF